MKSIYDWLAAYGESHQNKTNKKIHWVCVPVIMFTLLGLLSLVKFNIGDFKINLAYILIALAWLFYLRLSIKISIGMFIISGLFLLGIYQLEQFRLDLGCSFTISSSDKVLFLSSEEDQTTEEYPTKTKFYSIYIMPNFQLTDRINLWTNLGHTSLRTTYSNYTLKSGLTGVGI